MRTEIDAEQTLGAPGGEVERLVKSKILSYWLGRMVPRALSFFLLPVYTDCIDPVQWGIVSLLWITGDFVALALNLQLPQAVFRNWALTTTEAEKQRLAGFILTAPLVISTAVFVPIYILADSMARWLALPDFGPYLRWYAGAVQLGLLLDGIQAILRVREEAKLFAVFDAGQRIFQAGLNVIFLLGLGLGIRGFVLSQFITCACAVALLLPRCLRTATLNLDRSLFSHLLAFSLPLVPSAIAMGMVHNFDRYLVETYCGTEEVGIYSMGYKLGTIMSLVVLGPFFLSWEPQSYEIAKRSDAGEKLGTVFSMLLAVLVFFAVGMIGASDEIVRVLTSPEYWDAKRVMPWIILAYIPFGLDSVVRTGLLYRRRSGTVLAVVLFALCINVSLNMLLLPRFGMTGAAASTLVSFTLLFCLDLVLSRRELPIHWEWRRMAITGIAGVAVLAGMHQVHSPSLWTSILAKGAVLLAYPLGLWAFGFFRASPSRLGSKPLEARS